MTKTSRGTGTVSTTPGSPYASIMSLSTAKRYLKEANTIVDGNQRYLKEER